MRMGCVPLLMMAAMLVQPQQDSLVPKPAGDLFIPAELSKTVRADKAHRGDPVEFTTLEAVLVGPNLVMPADSKLFGRVVGAAPRHGNKPSWIVLLVERAEWKKHSVALHAFISAEITLVPAPNPNTVSADTTPALGNGRGTGHVSVRSATQTATGMPISAKLPQDATVPSQEEPVGTPPALEKDVRIVRDKDGTSYLFSAKSNVKLPGGALFMLQNYPPIVPHQSAAARPH